MRGSEKAGLARVSPLIMSTLRGQSEEGGNPRGDLASQLGEGGSNAGPATGRLRPLGLAPGQTLNRIMAATSSYHRPDHGELIHHPGHLREQFADLNPGNIGRDRFKLSPDAGGGLHLEIPHVLVGRAACQEDHDNGLVIERFALRPGFGLQDLRQGRASQSECSYSEKPPASHPVAEGFSLCSGNRQHGRENILIY